ncbi:MAG: signal peptidase II [Alphaproteobacteria bacterium]|jgi:signal peptidase II|nr:signal peptidase II [Alphaproteobacteria bacterium]
MKLLKSFNKKQLSLLLSLIIILVVIDQLIKYWVSNNLIRNFEYITILSFLEIRYIINTGVSFSFLDGINYQVIALLSFAACILAIFLIAGFYKSVSKEFIIVLALLLAGSIGNLIDRLLFKGVIDYIHFHLGGYSFPIFNLADVYITFCSIIIIKNVILSRK